jgi:carboxymethylenebutenolidase
MSQIKAGEVEFKVNGKPASGYLAAPQDGGPGVIVLHAWWGLFTFFKELCKRLAAQGSCPGARSEPGKVAETIEAAQEIMSGRDFEFTRAVVAQSVEILRHLPGVQKGRLGAVGFSMGASWALVLASHASDEIAALVLFYGAEVVDFSQMRAACQGHYAGTTIGRPLMARKLEEYMHAAGLAPEFYIYPGPGTGSSKRTAWRRTTQPLPVSLGAHDRIPHRANWRAGFSY